MCPVLFRIPYLDIPIPAYGVALVIALFSGISVGVRNGVHYGLDRKLTSRVALRGVIAGLIGAKVLAVILELASGGGWNRALSLDLLLGGGAYYGGFLTALVVSAALAIYYRLPAWTVADSFAPGIVLGQAIGRLGCFAAGCCWGVATDSWIGVQFPAEAHDLTGVPIGVGLHPVQLYESFFDLLIFVFLMRLRDRRSFRGQIMLLYIALYALLRFALEFVRGEPTAHIGPLTTFQALALFLALTSLLIAGYRFRTAARSQA